MSIIPLEASILPPTDGHVFKKMMTAPGQEKALGSLISATLGRQVSETAVVQYNLERLPLNEVEMATDITALIDGGVRIGLEMQGRRLLEVPGSENRIFFRRSMYWLTDLYAWQPANADPKEACLLIFSRSSVLAENEGYRTHYTMAAEYRNGCCEDSSTMRLIVVELPKARHLLERSVEQMSLLDKWVMFLLYAAGRKHRELMNKVIRSEEALSMAADQLLKISQDDVERALFRSRRKHEADRQSDIRTAESIGRTKGMEIGYEQGRHEQAVETARVMLQDGEPAERIIRYSGLTASDIEELCKERA